MLQSIRMGHLWDEKASYIGIVSQRLPVNAAVHKIESGRRFCLTESSWLILNLELETVGGSGSPGRKKTPVDFTFAVIG